MSGIEGVEGGEKEVDSRLAYAVDPELREERVDNLMRGIQRSTGYRIPLKALREEAESKDNFIAGVAQHLIDGVEPAGSESANDKKEG